MPPTARFIEPQWPVPGNIFAGTTTRVGGVSTAPYASFNLGHHVGDEALAVARNRRILAASLPPGTAVQWLSQVHGVRVVQANPGSQYPQADAAWSQEPGIACAVLSADCLPVLFCAAGGDRVAAAHAGWRGLLEGVLEATVSALARDPGQLLAWLGPAIGPRAFEVGPEVKERFLAVSGGAEAAAVEACFVRNAANPGHYFADLYALARLRLRALGLTRVFGGGLCTLSDSQRFYSYRREGQTGRMASIIAIRPAQALT